MPTVLAILGWRFFFYANEGNEPIHVHCRKAGAEAKYWLDVESFEAIEAHSYSMSPADKRAVRRIIFEHFDPIVTAWREHFGENRARTGSTGLCWMRTYQLDRCFRPLPERPPMPADL